MLLYAVKEIVSVECSVPAYKENRFYVVYKWTHLCQFVVGKARDFMTHALLLKFLIEVMQEINYNLFLYEHNTEIFI